MLVPLPEVRRFPGSSSASLPRAKYKAADNDNWK